MDELYNDIVERGLINKAYSVNDMNEFVTLKETTTGIGLVEIEETDTYHFTDFESGNLPMNIQDKMTDRRN